MKVHTNRFKEKIGSFGRQIDSIITYQLNGVTQTITSENLNGVTPTFQGSILKSVMKQLDLDSNINIPIGTSINYKFGVLVDGKFEYLDFGNYVVYSSEKQEDYDSYKIVCYDKMLYSMKQNEDLGVTYPISVRDYLKALCNKLGLQFKNANDNFVNYSRMIQKELYVGLDYTYRDILDELAQVTASTICLNENDELELRYISNNVVDTIDEEYLKDINVNFGQKYGPVNSIVLSRSAESDNVYLQDEESIQANGLCELKIVDNQIMNWNDRSDYLPEILAELDGLEYYINDFVSTGIAYLELCDRYNVKIGDNTYSCVMLNDELEVTQGLVENIHTDMPEETETDYTKADKTDRKINNVSIIVDKQQNQIELLANKIVDISAQASGHKEVELENCSATPLYKLKITGDDSLLFPGDKKKYFTYETYEGSSIDVDIKGSSYDINNLEVKGRSTQEVRSGKNLFDTTKYTTTANINVISNTNGTLDLQGISGYYAGLVQEFSVIPNQQYKLSYKATKIDTSSATRTFVRVRDNDNSTNLGDNGAEGNITINFTPPHDKIFIFFSPNNAGNNGHAKFENIQLEKGSTVTPYEQYGVSPSPDFPSEINNVKGNIQIINTGKNLFDEDKAKKRDNYNISLSNNYKGITICLKPNTKYSISRIVDSSLSADTGYNLQFVKEDKSTPFFYLNNSAYSQNVISGTTTFTTEDTGVIYLATLYGNDTRLSTYFSNVNVQLEEGETVTSYEPYKSQTLNIDLQGNELCSIGDTKDILDISVTGDTKINKKIGKVVLDGSENWRIGTAPNQTNTTYFSCDSYDNIISAKTNKIMSDYFLYNNDLWLRDVEGIYFDIVNSNLIRIRISKDIVTTVEEFKTWLSTHNVTVIYELATPETINLSPTNPLYLYDGINHLTNDNNADMVAKMVKSTMFLKTSDLYINQGQSNEKKYDLKIPALRELNGVKDEYNLENTKATLTKRIGLNANLEEYILTEPQIIDLGEMTIELNEGTNILTMPIFPNNYYEVTYLLKNEYTDVFASQAELHSEINVTSDKIELLSKKKVNNDEIIASINLTPEKAQIDANKISLKGKEINLTSDEIDITSNNFKVDKQGNLECTNAKVQGKIESNEGNVGGWTISNGSLNNGKNFVRANGFSNIYTMSEIFVLQAYILEQSWAKETIDSDQDLFNFYDVNHDGVIDIIDLLRMKKMIMGVEY